MSKIEETCQPLTAFPRSLVQQLQPRMQGFPSLVAVSLAQDNKLVTVALSKE